MPILSASQTPRSGEYRSRKARRLPPWTAAALPTLLALTCPATAQTPPSDAPPDTQTKTATLHVTVPNVDSAEGSIRVFVYGGPEGFRDQDRAIAKAAAPARPGPLEITLEGLPPGRRAVILYHDDNDDGALNRFLGMIPTEGYGVSNDPALSGPPSFDAAAVVLPAGDTQLTVTLRY